MKRILLLIFSFSQFLILFTACDHIDESERLIYVQSAPVGRNVLIEDYTGQNCQNCPTATQTIAQLQEAYGEDTVVAVAIHSGNFGYMRGDRSRPYPLTTDLGDSYFKHWGLSSQPVGIVNRQGSSDYSEWGTQVRQQMGQQAQVSLEAEATYDEAGRSINIKVSSTALESGYEGKLQVWLTEDSIVEGQRMPDGVWNAEYVHNHVFRDAVNGTWGTDFSIKQEETLKDDFSYTLPDGVTWKPEHMHAVVFVYNDAGVDQVVSAAVTVPSE